MRQLSTVGIMAFVASREKKAKEGRELAGVRINVLTLVVQQCTLVGVPKFDSKFRCFVPTMGVRS